MTITTKILDKIGFLRNFLLVSKNSRTKFPDFLGIGAQKSGTTWLFENLNKHPQLYLPKKKEIHFFDWHFYKGLEWYYKYFKDAEKTQYKGEITPAYSIISKTKIKFINKLNPKLKIILLLRNPIERAWSHAVMNLSTIPKKDISLISDKEFIDHFNHSRSMERGDYLKIISNWKIYFASNQIFIRDYYQLKDNPEKLLNEVFNFLDINQVTDWNEYPVRKKIGAMKREKNKNPPYKLQEYLIKIYSNDIKELKKIIKPISW